MRKFRDDGMMDSQKKGRPSTWLRKRTEKKRSIESTPEERDRIKELENKCVPFRLRMPFKRAEEAAKTGSPTKTNESIARIIHSLRGSFKLVELLETLNFPKATFMYWQNDLTETIPIKESKPKCFVFVKNTKLWLFTNDE